MGSVESIINARRRRRIIIVPSPQEVPEPGVVPGKPEPKPMKPGQPIPLRPPAEPEKRPLSPAA